MSADNGIYIAKFPDGYRVSYASTIENIDYYPEGSKNRKMVLKEYFGDSKVYETEIDALAEAREIEKGLLEDEDFYYIEYGICFLGEYESF
jgi:hypothetical protein